MKVFLAGATGVIGRRLVLLLRKAGHDVVGTTRSETKAAALQALGATAAVVDAYDAQKLKLAVYAAQPDVIIHQLTDLPQELDPDRRAAALAANARLRIEGTRNLVDAALASGVRRIIAQSIAFAYAPGQGAVDRRSSARPITGRRHRARTGGDADTGHRWHCAALWPFIRAGHMDQNRQGVGATPCRCGGAGGVAGADAWQARHLQYR